MDVRYKDAFLCKNQVRIPELGIDDFIKWDTNEEGFFLNYLSCQLLRKSGRKIYVNVRDSKGTSITKQIYSQMSSMDFSYEKFGVWIWFLKDTKFEFSLLNEDGRDFSLNPQYKKLAKITINSESLAAKLKSDFGNLLKNPVMSDLTLNCRDGSLKAHKAILISRCAFFEKMFAYETVESATSVVKCDFSIKVMKTILDYVYRGKIEESKVYEIYEAVDYYDLVELKGMCEKILWHKLNPENVISLLRLAETCNDTEMLNSVLSYISWNAKYVKQSKDYLELVNNDSDSSSGQLLKLVDEALALTLAKLEFEDSDDLEDEEMDSD